MKILLSLSLFHVSRVPGRLFGATPTLIIGLYFGHPSILYAMFCPLHGGAPSILPSLQTKLSDQHKSSKPPSDSDAAILNISMNATTQDVMRSVVHLFPVSGEHVVCRAVQPQARAIWFPF